MFQLLKLAAESLSSRVSDGERLKAAEKKGLVSEERVLICKNNVCVHASNSCRHSPGYFSLKNVEKAVDGSDLILYWVPNTLLAVGIDDINEQKNEQNELPGVLLCSQINENIDEVQDDGKSPPHLDVDDDDDDDEAAIKLDEEVSSSVQLSPSKLNESFSTPYGGVFNINLSEMKTIKIFFSSKELISGQLVVCNLENQYKVFHFHHSGIDNVAKVFADWGGCKEDVNDNVSETMQRIFVVTRNLKSTGKVKTYKSYIQESLQELHPEDGNVSSLNSELWKSLLNPMGQIEDVNSFRKHVFFSGVSEDMRTEVWKFLLYYYPVQSTSFERDKMKKVNEIEYQAIHEKRIGLKGEEYETFWKDVQLTVDKDVVRTDRSHPYFIGEQNPNIEKMRNILLNYAVYNPDIGYTQGMSDLLSPVLAVIEDEAETFWCFVGLMQFSLFTTTPKDCSMEKSLGFLRELLRVLYPDFYIHCLMQDEDLSLLFCHRWLVLCFKREFIENQVLQIWEACWSRYQTDYFHIFICVAILRLYGKKCVENKMRMDEMMQYFMDLAMQFDGNLVVLKEARSLLYRFRKFQVIPCTLQDLLSGPGVWDGGIQPDIECVSRNRKCCFIERIETP